jgi:hypothetical protein
MGQRASFDLVKIDGLGSSSSRERTRAAEILVHLGGNRGSPRVGRDGWERRRWLRRFCVDEAWNRWWGRRLLATAWSSALPWMLQPSLVMPTATDVSGQRER